MLNISINLETGLAKPSQSAVIKAGGMVPVTITFTSNPGASPVIELALSPQSSSPTVLAYLDEFDAESQTVYTGQLDANDTRLIAHLAGKEAQVLGCEAVVTTVADGRRPFPNFPITCQQPTIVGPAASEGGPVYLTTAQGDARYPIIGEASGTVRISADGLEIKDTATNVWRRVTFINGEIRYTEL